MGHHRNLASFRNWRNWPIYCNALKLFISPTITATTHSPYPQCVRALPPLTEVLFHSLKKLTSFNGCERIRHADRCFVIQCKHLSCFAACFSIYSHFVLKWKDRHEVPFFCVFTRAFSMAEACLYYFLPWLNEGRSVILALTVFVLKVPTVVNEAN